MKMKRKPATTKLRKIVEERRFIDAETGEEDSIPVISMEEKDCNFQKLFLGHVLDAINSIGNQKIKVLMWMIEHRDAENRIVGTHRSIADVTGCAKQTVTSVLKSLMDHDVIRLVQQGVYQLNPDVIWKGSHGKRKRVILDYGKNEEKASKKKKEHIRLV